MKVTLFALFMALLMVGFGESQKPSGRIDMTGTAPRNDVIETAVDWSKLSPQQQMAALATVRSSAEKERLFILELEDYSPEEEEADGSYTGI